MGIHLQNLLGENNHEGVQKPYQKDCLQINVAFVGMPIWNSQMKAWGLGLVCGFLKKMGENHLIKDVK